MSQDGLSNPKIARRLEVSSNTVGKWRRRFLARGLMGFCDELRPGCPRSIPDEKITALIKKTLEEQLQLNGKRTLHDERRIPGSYYPVRESNPGT